jgi:mono/diheme cytochrome c family protein
MFRRQAILSLLYPLAIAFTQAAKKPEVVPPWNQWIEKDFPFFSAAVDAREKPVETNLTPRALVFPLGEDHFLAYDLDLLRVAVAWKAEEVPFRNASMSVNSYPYQLKKVSGGQGALPKPNGEILFQNGIYPGVGTGSPDFTDSRPPPPTETEVGRGGIHPEQARFRGINLQPSAEIEYEVGGIRIKERFRLKKDGLIRHLKVDAHKKPIYLILATEHATAPKFICRGKGTIEAVKGHLVCMIPASRKNEDISIVFPITAKSLKPTQPVAKRWKKKVRLPLTENKEGNALHFEPIPLPLENPYQRAVRAAGIDFFKDGRIALVTFDGDVWIGEGLRPGSQEIHWSRFASGLHEPLGLRLREEEIFVFDRNGLWRLQDRDGNGEADYHELFCSQIDQTAETREFASALEVEKDGGFLVCKPGQTGSTMGRSSSAILRISPDGQRVTRLAHGFRQPYLGYDPVTGQIAASDQQGHYVPSTPVDFVKKGAFYGHPNEPADKDRLVSPPLTWIPHQECGSGAAIIWMRNSKMEALADQPVLLSFNPPRLFQIHAEVNEFVTQGGVTPLQLPLDDPLLKGAINPVDGLLYLTGLNIWGTKAKGKTFLGRVRPNPKRTWTIPTHVQVAKRGIFLRFATPLATQSASKRESYEVRRWNYKRTPNYGSPNYKLDGTKGTETLVVASVKLSEDKQAVFLGIPDMREVMQIEVGYKITAADDTPIQNKTFLTAHLLRKLALGERGFADNRVDLKVDGLAPVTKRPAKPSLEKGKFIYAQLGCVACHSVDGSREGKTGPSWLGLFGSKRKLTTGQVVVANEAYIRESILNPAAKVAEGAVNGEAGMPIYDGVLNEEQIASIILYARSLGK